MKKYTLFSLAPLLALLVAGCSSPIAMQSSEYDDMYYSSSDQTVYVQPESNAPEQQYASQSSRTQEPLGEDEVLNPEYRESNAAAGYAYSDEYYDGRDYDPRDNWYRPSHSYVDPYWGAAYTPRMASYAFYDPFYDPFFDDPFAYSSFSSFRRNPYWGNGLSVSISYGMNWGGFYNRPYYSNWWPGSYGYNYYNGFRNGYYNGFHNGYYAGSPYNNMYFDRPLVVTNPVRLQNRPRDSRSAVVSERPANTGRPARGEAFEGGSRESRQVTTRPARRGESVGTTSETQERRTALPARPSRPMRQSEATNSNEQQQRVVTPRRTERRSAPAQEYRQQQQQINRPRPIESRPTRTYESRPERSSYESSSPSFNNSNSSSGSSGSSSGSRGGRPTRGN